MTNNASSLSDNDRADKLERAMVGLLADILDHWDGYERNLDVTARDLMRYFDLTEVVEEHRKG